MMAVLLLLLVVVVGCEDEIAAPVPVEDVAASIAPFLSLEKNDRNRLLLLPMLLLLTEVMEALFGSVWLGGIVERWGLGAVVVDCKDIISPPSTPAEEDTAGPPTDSSFSIMDVDELDPLGVDTAEDVEDFLLSALGVVRPELEWVVWIVSSSTTFKVVLLLPPPMTGCG